MRPHLRSPDKTLCLLLTSLALKRPGARGKGRSQLSWAEGDVDGRRRQESRALRIGLAGPDCHHTPAESRFGRICQFYHLMSTDEYIFWKGLVCGEGIGKRRLRMGLASTRHRLQSYTGCQKDTRENVNRPLPCTNGKIVMKPVCRRKLQLQKSKQLGV